MGPIKFSDQSAKIGKSGEKEWNAEKGEQNAKTLTPWIRWTNVAPTNGSAQFKGIKEGTMEWFFGDFGVNASENDGTEQKPKESHRNDSNMRDGTKQKLNMKMPKN